MTPTQVQFQFIGLRSSNMVFLILVTNYSVVLLHQISVKKLTLLYQRIIKDLIPNTLYDISLEVVFSVPAIRINSTITVKTKTGKL